MGKGFELGSPFSPSMLSAIQDERRRRDAKQSQGNADAFRAAQLKASVDTQNRERALRVQMANTQFNMANARTAQEQSAHRKQFDEMQRQFDINADFKKQSLKSSAEETTTKNDFLQAQFKAQQENFLRQQTERERHNKEGEATAEKAAKNRAEYLALQGQKFDLQLGKEYGVQPGTPQSDRLGGVSTEAAVPGSIAHGRKMRASKTEQDIQVGKQRAELAAARLAGTLPEQVLAEKKFEVQKKTQELAEEALTLRSTNAAASLALKMLEQFTDEYSGTVQLPSQELIGRVANTVSAMFDDDNALMLAFNNAYRKALEKRIQDRNVRMRQEAAGLDPAGNPLPGAQPGRAPGPQERGGLVEAGKAYDRVRQRAKKNAGR